MGNRLSKIVTKTGDRGQTGLGDGTRVGKDSARIQVIGSVDELNSSIGVLLTEKMPPAMRKMLLKVQQQLFDLGGELCMPGRETVTEEHVDTLDAAVWRYNAQLSPLREFVLPGGARSAALAHLARTVCRRAERDLTVLGRTSHVGGFIRQYLNRLSDLLFILGRVLNKKDGRKDVLWKHERKRSRPDRPTRRPRGKRKM